MILAELPFGANWFDVLWAIALLYGLWDGIRSGFVGEVVRVGGWVLMLWLGLKYYLTAGDWMKKQFMMDTEVARLTAFVVIVLGTYIVMLIIRHYTGKWTTRMKRSGLIENVGGALLGVSRLAMAMAFLTIWLSLVRSPFWHRHVSKESRFGSSVVNELPDVKKVVETPYPEKFPLFRDIERPIDADEEDITLGNKTPAKKKAR